MPMYVRKPVPASVVAALAVLAVFRKAHGRNLRLNERIVLGEVCGGEALAVECEDVTRLSER